ncbi:MAG: molybdopterin-dependent oxidoreductase [Pirellulaceae bacterium]|nr:molybdopterin-dependent oxidoreductase [Pirellulaceae bacterium]
MQVSALAASAIQVSAEESKSNSAIESTIEKEPDFPPPLLTPAAEFRDVSRGKPKPHTLVGEALVQARLTPETWRLEIVADSFTSETVKLPAQIAKTLTIEDGTAIDLPMLMDLGKRYSVRFLKAMQCLNIATPLGNGLWEGVPLREILKLCGKSKNVRRIYYDGFHNNDPEQLFQSSLSYSQVMETPPGELPVFLAYRLNDEPIPLLRGGPVRMVVPWAFGFKSIKWLRRISLTNDYRSNDTYAEANNDPESQLKTAAYLDELKAEYAVGQKIFLRGQVICGRSGLSRVEYWIRRMDEQAVELAEDDPTILEGPWKECDLEEPPSDWNSVFPDGVDSKNVLGFDSMSGQPLTWPLKFSMASYSATITGLAAGKYEVRTRSVDLNDYAQPEPRPYQKSGKNAIQVRRFIVVG